MRSFPANLPRFGLNPSLVAVLAGALLALQPAASHGAQIFSNYDPFEVGCTQSWTEGNCWDPGDIIPNNNLVDQYRVSILFLNGVSNVPLDLELDSLTTVAGIVLDIQDGGTFQIVGSDVARPGTGVLENAGTININGTGSLTDWIVDDGTVTVSDGGTINLSDQINNRIRSGTGATLQNLDNLIQGAGQLGTNSMGLVNAGTIRANAPVNPLIIDPGAPQAVNSGRLEAASGGTLQLQNGTFTNTGGVIAAADASLVELSSVTITEGTLETSGSGLIRNVGQVVLDGASLLLDGVYENANSSTTTLFADLTNLDTLRLAGTGGLTDLAIDGGTVTLDGGGTVELADAVNNRIRSDDGSTLVNQDNLIHGAGQIGVNSLGVVNHATIRADATNALVIDPGAPELVNDSLMEAVGGSTLRLQNGTFTNTGGVIAADDGSLVELSTATIVGGTLQTQGSGVFRNLNTATLDGAGLLLDGAFEAVNSSTTTWIGDITNQGTVSILGTGGLTDLVMQGGTVTLDGAGTVTLSDHINTRIRSGDASTLVNEDNLIQGAGNIGTNSMGFTNRSTVRANGTSPLTIDPSALGAVNGSLFESVAGSTLHLLGGTFENFEGLTDGQIRTTDGTLVFETSLVDGGQVDVIGAGELQLDGSTVHGGLLQNSALGTVRTTGGTSQLGGTFLNPLGGELHVGNSTGLQLEDTGIFTNAGDWFLDSTGQLTDLVAIGGTVTLAGGGTLTLSDQINNRVRSSDGSTLQNQDLLIQGAGQLGTNSMGLVNAGTIRANAPVNPLIIDPGAPQAVNSGRLEAASGGTLQLQNGTFTNTGGVIAAADASLVELSSVTVVGGTLETTGSGVIRNVGNTTLDGAGLVIDGAFEAANGRTTTLIGSFTNQGSISLLGTGGLTDLVVQGGAVTFDGGGTIALSDHGNNRIRSGDGSTLVNQDNLIVGAGQLSVALQNSGTVAASGANDLRLLTSAKVNDGLFRADPGGTLSVETAVTGSGDWLADGGLIRLNSGVVASTTGEVAAANGGRLELVNATLAAGELTLAAGSSIDVGSHVQVAGSFSFGIADEADFVFDPDAVLEMVGGVEIPVGQWNGWGSLEIAGVDFGTDPVTHAGDPQGFVDNFSLPRLEIGAGAHVFLADLFDNGNRGGPFDFAESLYVDTLAFADPSGLLNLNGLHLYYTNIEGDPGQIIDQSVPAPEAPLPALLLLAAAAAARRQARR